MTTESPKKTNKISIIGGGVGGVSTALKLADLGYEVLLIEKNTLFSGASSSNPGRMGHGFHYTDIKTAIAYLNASIKVQRQYPGYLVGQALPFEHPLRHGRYFVLENSDDSPETVLATYQAIQKEYQRLVKLDPENEVFGPPETFFRILKPDEYGPVNQGKIKLGVETCEHLFNFQAFANDLRAKVENHPNITLREHTEVQTITRNALKDIHDAPQSRFTLHAVDRNGTQSDIPANYVINSTWYNIKKINDQMGLRMAPGERTNRLKALVEVELPESLKNVNSMFFCMGQFGMMSNLGNGRAMFTYAKVTNLEASSELSLSARAERFLRGEATEEEKAAIADEMLAGISQFIPDMKNATIKSVKFGIVQTLGHLTLAELGDKKSSFHKRDDHNVVGEQIGVISNPCMKLFYFADNAELATELLELQIRAADKVTQCLALIQQETGDTRLTRIFQEQLERNEPVERLLTNTPAEIVAFYSDLIKKRAKIASFFALPPQSKGKPPEADAATPFPT